MNFNCYNNLDLFKLMFMELAQNPSIENLLALGLQARILIVEKLWQSILSEMKLGANKISAEQIAEIDRRLENLEKGESKLYSWQDVRQSISKHQ